MLDLGSGPGLDAFLAAKAVGPAGRVIGVDMTPGDARARAAQRRAGRLHERRVPRGRLEKLPVADASIDAVTSNCVINLVPDKPAVFREIARVLKPGGRLVVSDIVLDGALPAAIEKDLYAYVGCISGRGAARRPTSASSRPPDSASVEVLQDFDYLELWAQAAPAEAQALLERTGVSAGEVAGKVRSLTFRARKPR